MGPTVLAQRPRVRHDPRKPAWDQATCQRAMRQIPVEDLQPSWRDEVSAVLDQLTIFRRLPVRVIPCDPEFFSFLLLHPDVVVATWQVLGISELELRRIGPDAYRLTDRSGTDAIARIVYRRPDMQVAYVEGTCGGPFFAKPAQGRAVLVLKSGWVREPDGQYYVTTRLDAFVRVDNGGLELLTKAFQPVIGKVVDNNFTQTVTYVGCLSRTAEVNPSGMQRLAKKLTQVDPDVRDEFARVAARVAERAERVQRTASRDQAAGSGVTNRN